MGRPGAHERVVQERVRDDLLRLAHRGRPMQQFSLKVGEALCRAVDVALIAVITQPSASHGAHSPRTLRAQ